MTLDSLLAIIAKHNIPSNVKLMSDSGWECDATNINGVYYNSKTNTIVFTQETKYNKYNDLKDWKCLN